MKHRNSKSESWLLSFLTGLLLLCTNACQKVPEYYSFQDFEELKKIDAHFHYNVFDTRLMEFAESLNFKIASPNTRTIYDEQFNVARSIKEKYPENFAFFGNFSLENWDQPVFYEQTIKRIKMVLDAGAIGIKIWKDLGMVLQDSSGKYIMVDHPAFSPIFNYLEENNITVMGHFGEPKNCWLPLEEMTVKSNRDYYRKNPQYHMYLHPGAPSYEDQIIARDNILERHPDLNFIGAHLGSLEWNVDELAKHLDRFPNSSVDMAGRINHLQYQSLSNFDGVRDFLINYQDRILYATDRSIRPQHTDLESVKENVLKKWQTEWMFLATDTVFQSSMVFDQSVKGLKLPKEVIDKIYYSNAEYLFQPR